MIDPFIKAKRQSFKSCRVGNKFFRPLGTGNMSSGFSGSILAITSPTAKIPIATITKSMPPSSSVWPKVKREVAVNKSVPIPAIHRPNVIASRALVNESPANRTTMARPSTINAKYSGELKARLSFASGGATSISKTVPMVPATKEAMALMPSAAPARPWRAIW